MAKAMRHNEGKPQLHWVLTAPDACKQIATVMAKGAEKYEINNWKDGFVETEALDSVLRHIAAHLNGEEIDIETDCQHLSLALTGLLMHVDNINRLSYEEEK